MRALTVLVLALVALQLLRALRRSWDRRGRALELLRGLRLRHVWPAPFVLAAIIGAFAALYEVPPLRWGWWSALGGQGNIVFGSTEQTRGTALEVLLPVVFGLLLLPALPLLVEAEERRFRFGAERWSTPRRALRGLQFGLFHLLAGIPIAAALALSIAGWWLTAVYVRAFRRTGSPCAAFDESTRAHLGYDVVIVGVVVLGFALGGCSDRPEPLVVQVDGVPAGGTVPAPMSCLGENAPPTVRWSGGPTGAAGWAVVVEDPDAPTGTFTHWVVTGLGADVRSVRGTELPEGAVVSLTSAGQAAWLGPCPPGGETHRYRFRVHALSSPVRLDPSTAPAEARRTIESSSLDAAQIEATFTGV